MNCQENLVPTKSTVPFLREATRKEIREESLFGVVEYGIA